MRHGGVWYTIIDSSEKTVAILGDGWWPQAAKPEGDKTSENIKCKIWKHS